MSMCKYECMYVCLIICVGSHDCIYACLCRMSQSKCFCAPAAQDRLLAAIHVLTGEIGLSALHWSLYN